MLGVHSSGPDPQPVLVTSPCNSVSCPCKKSVSFILSVNNYFLWTLKPLNLLCVWSQLSPLMFFFDSMCVSSLQGSLSTVATSHTVFYPLEPLTQGITWLTFKPSDTYMTLHKHFCSSDND